MTHGSPERLWSPSGLPVHGRARSAPVAYWSTDLPQVVGIKVHLFLAPVISEHCVGMHHNILLTIPLPTVWGVYPRLTIAIPCHDHLSRFL